MDQDLDITGDVFEQHPATPDTALGQDIREQVLDETASLLSAYDPNQLPKINANSFADISFEYMETRTFWGKCVDTFFVFLGDSKKTGLVAHLSTGAPFIILALSPLLLFLGPLLFLANKHKEQKKLEDNPDAKSKHSSLAWFLAILWAIPGIVGGFAAIVGLGVAGLALGIAAVAAALGLLVAAVVTLLPGVPLLWIFYSSYKKHKKFSLAAWMVASILAIPSIIIVAGLIIAAAATTLALGISYLVVSVTLTIVSIPFIAIVHAIWGPSDPNGKTVVRRSFFLNPSTYVMMALLAGLSFFLIQHLNPALFINLAAPLMIVQTVLMSIAALAVVAGILYVGYRIALGFFPNTEPVTDETVDQTTQPVNVAQGEANYITKYLNEHWVWIKANWGKAGFFYGLMLVGVGGVTLLVANHFTAGLLFGAGTENLMKVVFDFMVSGFTSALQSMAGLPGLDSLVVSDATLMLIGQILTVFTLIAAAIVIPYTGARLCQTVQEEVSLDPEDGKEMLGRERGDQGEFKELFDSRASSQKKAINTHQFRAIFDFVGQSDFLNNTASEIITLSFKAGEIFTVSGEADEQGRLIGMNAAGRIGYIPSSHVEKVVEALEAPKQNPQ